MPAARVSWLAASLFAAVVAAGSADAQVYSNDFSANAANFTGGTLTTSPLGQRFLALNGGTATLSLTGLDPYTSGTVTFNVYAVGSPDGNAQNGGGIGDLFTVNGPNLAYVTNFANYGGGNTQAYPSTQGGPNASNPPTTGATATNTLGYTGFPSTGVQDSTYTITLPFMASMGTTLALTFIDSTNEGVANEFYGIDNVVVTTNGTRVTAVPGPIAGAGIPALLALGGALWARRRKAA